MKALTTRLQFDFGRFASRYLLLAVAGMPLPLLAHEEHAPILEEIVVYGRAEQAIGVAQAASSGMIGYDDIRLPPLLRVGELVEAVPGMVATQHSGSGKANQYFLRGFNLDHGTDFSAHAEGVPLNLRTHGHGQGYLDLNFLIPELVETTTYRKGPYSPLMGDFSSAGSVTFSFYDRLPTGLLSVSTGEHNYVRGLVADSRALTPDTVLTAAIDLTHYDGPWELEEDTRQAKFYAAYNGRVGESQAKFTLQGYDSEWRATDQIPARAVTDGRVGRLGNLDPDLGGDTHRVALTADFDFSAWHVGAYAIDYDFSLISNFTYLLKDPLQGDEFQQRDERRIFGTYVRGEIDRELTGRPLGLRWGLESRFDDIAEIGLYNSIDGQRSTTVREDAVQELSTGAYFEAEWSATSRLRTMLGVRWDQYRWDVDSDQALNSGTGRDNLVSPKLAMAYRLSDHFEVYANYGRGMHSNDVRGATISVDPVSGDPVEPVDVLVETEGSEVGLRLEWGKRANAALVYFWLDLDSELVFVGDGGSTEEAGASRREGLELSGFLQLNDWLALNASYTRTNASLRIQPGLWDRIPGAIEDNASLGLNAAWGNGFSASIRARYLGEAPLTEAGSPYADASTLVNGSLIWQRGKFEWRLDVFNLLDSKDHDIAYFYASRLPGEPTEGVEDVHFHPLEPRTVRGSLKWSW